MNYRVSFYRKSEVVAGRAPRYMVDVDLANSVDAAKEQVLQREPDIVIRSAYHSTVPIPEKISYVFD